MAFIFHIVEKNHWELAKKHGIYSPESMKIEGFVHCSKADQVLTVANSFYKDKDDLYLLKIDEEKINEKLVYEPPLEAPHSGVVFPHIYGDLNLDAVVKIFDFKKDEEGQFFLPKSLLD
jgi:uncharacterized protein (DUF952 family)